MESQLTTTQLEISIIKSTSARQLRRCSRHWSEPCDRSRKTMKHTEILQASPEAIWEAAKLADIILCKTPPDHFESTRLALGYGGPGSVRIITTGPGDLSHTFESTRLEFNRTEKNRERRKERIFILWRIFIALFFG